MSDDIEVHLDGIDPEPVLVGTLRPSFTGGRALASSSFEYSPDYLSHSRAYAISPELPLRSARTYSDDDRVLFGVFADAAPDAWGEKIVEAQHALRLRNDPRLPRRLGQFDFLLGVSDRTRMGALRLRRPGDDSRWLADDAGVANVHDLDRVIDVAARYERSAATDADVAYLSEIATSPGGARPKANIVLEDGTLALAKLPHSKDGDVDVEGWEALALTLAARSGIRVPRFELYHASPSKSVLVSHRFDRDGAARRHGYLSAATAMGLGDHDSRGTSYDDLAETVAEISVDPADDLRELFRRVAFTVLINNVDDHWRNHGFLQDGSGWRLAPAFDINPSRTRGVLSSRRINDTDDPRDRDIRNLRASAAVYALTDAEATSCIAEVAEEVARWSAVAKELKLPSEQISPMSVAFDEDRIEQARQLGRSVGHRPEEVDRDWVPPHTRNGKTVGGYSRRRRP